MSSRTQLIASSTPPLTLRDRLDLLEQRCTGLWADEPVGPEHREHAFAQLSGIEHRVVGLILRSLAEPDDPSLHTGADGCEQDLEQLGVLWSTPRAA